ncbi:MAG: hypothetical protein C0594_05240 [Marinilabiliales bacterium]|mgnify:CR=1 FL=1|nr:MAG: hypothetical protein C0594_05240 [Marinilabiliales bacterium]
MEKKIFEKDFSEKLAKNYNELSSYFDFELKVLCEFNTLIFEINKCLILELNRAAITLTNHFIERLLKVALIKNEAGIGPKPVDKWNDAYAKPTQQYGNLKLWETIKICREKNLINEQEKSFLNDIVRDMVRNGFSHADVEKIMKKYPDNVVMYEGSFSNPGKLKEVSVNQKLIPEIQAIQIAGFAEANARVYFDFVFNLLLRIEQRLTDKYDIEVS